MPVVGGVKKFYTSESATFLFPVTKYTDCGVITTSGGFTGRTVNLSTTVATTSDNTTLVDNTSFFNVIINSKIVIFFCSPIEDLMPNLIPDSFIQWYSTKTLPLRTKYISILTDLMITMFTFIISTLWIFPFILRVSRKVTTKFTIFRRISQEHDQEVFSLEDFIVFLVFLLAVITGLFNTYTASEWIQYNIDISMWFLLFDFFLVTNVVPYSIFFIAGANILIYMKGTDRNDSLISAIIFDIIGAFAFFLRFFLQLIRWVLFLTSFYLLHEFVFEWVWGGFCQIFNIFGYTEWLESWTQSNSMVELIVSLIRGTFELIDTVIVLTIQITAFIAVILWLFNYLFSVSIEDIYEYFYFFKRISC